jgi:hypothetical protein
LEFRPEKTDQLILEFDDIITARIIAKEIPNFTLESMEYLT